MNKRLTILVLIATMVLLGFVGSAMATKPLKLKGEKPFIDLVVTHNKVEREFEGTVNYIIQGKYDSNGGPAKLHIHFGVDGKAQDKDCKIRGAFNEKFDVDKGGKFTESFVKTFTYIGLGKGANVKITLKFTVTGNVNDPAKIAVTLRQQR